MSDTRVRRSDDCLAINGNTYGYLYMILLHGFWIASMDYCKPRSRFGMPFDMFAEIVIRSELLNI